MGSERLAGEHGVARTRRELLAMAGAGLTVWTAPQILDIKPAHAQASTTYRLATSGLGPCSTPAGWGTALANVTTSTISISGPGVFFTLAPGCSFSSGFAEVSCSGGSGGTVVTCQPISASGSTGSFNVMFTDPNPGITCTVIAAWSVISCIGS